MPSRSPACPLLLAFLLALVSCTLMVLDHREQHDLAIGMGLIVAGVVVIIIGVIAWNWPNPAPTTEEEELDFVDHVHRLGTLGAEAGLRAEKNRARARERRAARARTRSLGRTQSRRHPFPGRLLP